MSRGGRRSGRSRAQIAAAAGHAGATGRRGWLAACLRGLAGSVRRRPRLRIATLCLLGLLAGGLAGASLTALQLSVFGPEAAAPEAEQTGATAAVEAPAATPAVRLGADDALDLRPAEVGGRGDPATTPDAGGTGGTLSQLSAPEPEVARPSAEPEVLAAPAVRPRTPEPALDKPASGADARAFAFPTPSPPAPRGSHLALAEPAAREDGAADWQALYGRAHRLQAEGDAEAAIAAFGRAAAADPSHASTFYDWGYALQKAGRVEAAIEKYRRALELSPSHGHAHYNLGFLLQQKGELVRAVASYREAALIDQDNPYVFYNWGEILRRQGDIERAIDLYRRASHLAPDRQPGHDARGRLEQLLKYGSG